MGFMKTRYNNLIDYITQYVDNFLKMNKPDRMLSVRHTKKYVAQITTHYFISGKPLAIIDDLPTEEKIKIFDSFISDRFKRCLVGTNMVSANNDIKNLDMVILVNHVSSISEYIQIGGRLGKGGIYSC